MISIGVDTNSDGVFGVSANTGYNLGVQSFGGYLLRNENLPARDDIAKGNSGIVLPLLNHLLALNEDSELGVGASLVEDLGLSCVSTGHCDEVFEAEFCRCLVFSLG